jgi:hypothetical protein
LAENLIAIPELKNNFRVNILIHKLFTTGEPLWLSGKVVKNEKIKEIERTWVRSPPRAISLKNNSLLKLFYNRSKI